jgi:hypothetical protein
MLVLNIQLAKFAFNTISVVGVLSLLFFKMVPMVLVVLVNPQIQIILLLAGNPGLVTKISKIFSVMDMSVPILPTNVFLLGRVEVVNL